MGIMNAGLLLSLQIEPNVVLAGPAADLIEAG
jgi:hypothetical protein